MGNAVVVFEAESRRIAALFASAFFSGAFFLWIFVEFLAKKNILANDINGNILANDIKDSA